VRVVCSRAVYTVGGALFIAAVLTLTAIVPASAGTFRNMEGHVVKISCKSSGCYVNGKKVAPGSSVQYRRLVKKYKGLGYGTCGSSARFPGCQGYRKPDPSQQG